jgi:hypothetical protein
MNWKECEESCRGLFESTMPEFAWRGRGRSSSNVYLTQNASYDYNSHYEFSHLQLISQSLCGEEFNESIYKWIQNRTTRFIYFAMSFLGIIGPRE